MPRSQFSPRVPFMGWPFSLRIVSGLRFPRCDVDCRPLSHGHPAQTSVLSAARHVLRSLGRRTHWARVPAKTSRPRRRHRGLHIRRRRHADASRTHHRLHVFDGRQPLRPTEKSRRAGSERDRNGVSFASMLCRRPTQQRSDRCSSSISTSEFCITRPATRRPIAEINAATMQLQNQLWAAVIAPAKTQPSPVTALVVAGMNDVLNSQGYAQAAWWNRIPAAAWILLVTISIFCNLLIGYGVRLKSELLFLILPIVLSDLAFSDRGHRQSATRRDSCPRGKSGDSGGVA